VYTPKETVESRQRAGLLTVTSVILHGNLQNSQTPNNLTQNASVFYVYNTQIFINVILRTPITTANLLAFPKFVI
jgi:hypothetical protein